MFFFSNKIKLRGNNGYTNKPNDNNTTIKINK